MVTAKHQLSYHDYVQGIHQLTPEELVNLLEYISVTLKQRIGKKPAKHSIMELEGLGAELWEGIDAQEYVRQERASWDESNTSSACRSGSIRLR